MKNIKKKSFDYSFKGFELVNFIRVNSFTHLGKNYLGDLENV